MSIEMPTISTFYGISIKLFFNDHLPPHFHAIYSEYNGIFDLNTFEMIEGDLPPKAQTLVKEWAKIYGNEISKMWTEQKFFKLPGL